MAEATKAQRLPACANCRRLKAKCDRLNEQTACARCLHLNIKCESYQPIDLNRIHKDEDALKLAPLDNVQHSDESSEVLKSLKTPIIVDTAITTPPATNSSFRDSHKRKQYHDPIQGDRVTKYFAGFGKYDGTVIGMRQGIKGMLFMVKFDDEDAEEFEIEECRQLIQWHSNPDAFEQFHDQLRSNRVSVRSGYDAIQVDQALTVMETKIKLLQENPKRLSTKSWTRYEKYKAATTVSEYLQFGGLRADIKFDYQRGFIGVLHEDGTEHWANRPTETEESPLKIVSASSVSESSISITENPSNPESSIGMLPLPLVAEPVTLSPSSIIAPKPSSPLKGTCQTMPLLH